LAILVSAGGNLLAQASTQKPTTQKPNNTKPVPAPPPVASPDYTIGRRTSFELTSSTKRHISGDFVVRP
jgi:hypothetical protein